MGVEAASTVEAARPEGMAHVTSLQGPPEGDLPCLLSCHRQCQGQIWLLALGRIWSLFTPNLHSQDLLETHCFNAIKMALRG